METGATPLAPSKKRRPRRGKKSLGRIGSGVHLLGLRSSQFPNSEPHTQGPKRMAEMLVECVGLLASADDLAQTDRRTQADLAGLILAPANRSSPNDERHFNLHNFPLRIRTHPVTVGFDECC
jgi:hypothetical protein